MSNNFFHALNALIRSNPVHGNFVCGSVLRWVSAVYQPQGLVEREPRRPGMAGQLLILRDGGIEAELERGVSGHTVRIPPHSDNTLTRCAVSVAAITIGG